MAERDPKLAALKRRRYIALIRWLGEQSGMATGWQSFAAKTLGVSRAYVSQLLSGRRGAIGPRAVRLACEFVPGVTPEYFTRDGDVAPCAPDVFRSRIQLPLATTKRLKDGTERVLATTAVLDALLLISPHDRRVVLRSVLALLDDSEVDNG
jgi:hypothetical protein